MKGKRLPVSTVVESRIEFYPKDDTRVHFQSLKNIPDNVSPGRRQFLEILHLAVEGRFWSVNIEPQLEVVRVRGRQGQTWRLLASYPAELHKSVADEIGKFMRIDIHSNFAFEDGCMLVVFSEGDWCEVFVNAMQGIDGVIFHLEFQRREMSFDADLDKLGLDKNSLAIFVKAVDAKNGLLLITGPTGSGKSILTYSALVRRLTRGDSVVTVERPRKFFLPNAVQLGLEGAEEYDVGIKRALAHDPRVMMVQETLHLEEMGMALATAKSDRLVITASHTIDAVDGLYQLLAMRGGGWRADGSRWDVPPLDPKLIAESLRLVCSPRLLSCLCPHCRREKSTSTEVFRQAGLAIAEIDVITAYTGGGCPEYGGSGFSGWTGIYEVLPISNEMKKLIVNRRPKCEFAAQARREKLVSLRELALRKALAGVVTVGGAIFGTPPPYFVSHAKSTHRPIYKGEKNYVAPPDSENFC